MATGTVNFTDKSLKRFAEDLVTVLEDLEKRIVGIINGTQTARDVFDSTAILNSRAAMLNALEESGYNELARAHVAKYGEIPAIAGKDFTKFDLPAPKFTTVDTRTMQALSRADLEGFASIGTKAMDDLRLGIYKQAVASQPFSELVATVKAATVGTAKNGSALSNYAYTHANTAMLNFEGEVLRMAGESIGFDGGDDLWIVEGPDDAVTRDVCQDALNDPVRTKEEWQDIGYWGGTPGGWNCRHQLFPYQGSVN